MDLYYSSRTEYTGLNMRAKDTVLSVQKYRRQEALSQDFTGSD